MTAPRKKPPTAERPGRPGCKFGLRAVALFEGAKGILVLLAGLELFSILHQDVQQAAEELLRFLHLNPANRYPRIFTNLLAGTDRTELWLLSAAALGYAAVRFLEAFGLWNDRTWAEWLALLSAALYLPAAAYEIALGLTSTRLLLLAGDLGLIAFMAWLLTRKRSRRILEPGEP
ncbi:MAG: DUF2127 domain-containing protein [Acidobacteriota bacterium]